MRDPDSAIVIADQDLETWGGILLDHSLGGIDSSDRVMIKGESVCWPLIRVLERRVFEAGGLADICLVPSNNDRGRVWSATAVRSAVDSARLDEAPQWHLHRYKSMTKYVEVLGAWDPSEYAGLEQDQLKRLAETDRPYSELRLAKPWVLTLYPTPGFAAMEGMDLDEYTRFLVKASTTDPRPLRDAEETLKPLFEKGKVVRIVTVDPSSGRELKLTIDIASSQPALSFGLRNFPDGEIFTSPDARATNGEVFIDLPVHYGGSDIRGIYLRFENGRAVEYRANEGGDVLAAIIETDEGSSRLGEVALGMNPGLERVLKHPLLVEKVGGTLHIALGASYKHCYVEDPGSESGAQQLDKLIREGVVNVSAQHVDIVADFRGGGCGRSVFIDDTELVVRNAVWVAAD
ncbi:MAG: aminopeptidase [bacterium]|nr:aminopeptidase [bacterium]